MIFTCKDTFFKYPFGAVAENTTVNFNIVLTREHTSPTLQVYANENFDSPTYVIPMQNIMQRGTENIYTASFKPEKVGLYFYNFVTDKGRRIGRGDSGEGVFDDPDLWQITVYSEKYQTPHCYSGKIFYQIFPDRFYNSGEPKENVPSDRIIHQNWYDNPIDCPNEKGIFACNDYFGGDLKGITEKLDYIKSLGVYGIYLNPIFEAHSNHRYNTANYMEVDSLLGTKDDFKELCRQAHKRNMKIVLDGVFNHTGSDSVYFNREGRYEGCGAYNDPNNSEYKSWFNIRQDKSYDSWWGFETLPNVNENSPEYREFICGKNGVLRTWLRLGADGWRLDVADELPDDFIADIRTAIKTEKPDALLLGEVWEDASNKCAYGERRKYFWGKELDSVMNYPWRSAILDFIRYGNGMGLLESIYIIMENYPSMSLGTALNSLSTHDVPRAITMICNEPMDGKNRDWQRQHNKLSPEQYFYGRQMFMLASTIQYTLPGCPCLYYGDEAGLVGYADPFNRGTYPWDREDMGLLNFMQLLGKVRNESKALKYGSFTPVWFDEKICVYTRTFDNEVVLVVINRSKDDSDIHYPLSYLENSEILLSVGGKLQETTIKGNSAVILKLS